MVKVLLFAIFAIMIVSGCSKTWSGIKQDTSEIFNDSKEAIHEATAPDTVEETSVFRNSSTPRVGEKVVIAPQQKVEQVKVSQPQTPVVTIE